jgi:sterol 3beta-glucosyltransferase
VRVALLTFGTRGDIQPFVAIAHALKERGHDVVFVASKDQVPFAARVGVETVALPMDAKAIMQSEEGQHLLRNGHLLRFALLLKRLTRAYLNDAVPIMADAVKGADVVASHVLLLAYAMAFAEEQRLVRVLTVPLIPTRAFASPLVSRAQLGPFLNGMSHELVGRVGWWTAREAATASFRHVGRPVGENLLMRAERIGMPAINIVSKALLPFPADGPAHHVFTGDLRLSASARSLIGEGRTAPDLDAFLSTGPPPVFFGFGSMPVEDPRATLALVTQVARALDVRALLGAGWSAITPGLHADGRVFAIDAFDHDTVLPRCRAAVHHGGAGTTHAALRAGLPAVVCSFFVDQPWWADLLIGHGVGAKLPFPNTTAARLTDALRPLLSDAVKARAEALGRQLRAEDGLTVAVDAIERGGTRAARPS